MFMLRSLGYSCASLLAVLCIPTFAYAATPVATAAVTSTAAVTATVPSVKKLPILFCPPLDSLQKDTDGYWYANVEGGWKSTKSSFADRPTQFKGAQWSGVGVGTIVCYYTASNSSDSFPIELRYSVLVKDPTQQRKALLQQVNMPNNWQEVQVKDAFEQQIKIMNCASNNDIRNCPVLPGIAHQEQNVDKELEETKGSYNPLVAPNL